MTRDDMERAGDALREVWGHSSLRPGQKRAVEAVLEGADTLCVMPTGGGKSVCYQLPALLLDGTAVVFSPLIALMADQVGRLRGMGVASDAWHSGTGAREAAAIAARCASGETKLLYIAPERLDSRVFRRALEAMRVSLVAVDEAHCVSQWGHDFRPSYESIPRIMRHVAGRPPVMALTATATPRVADDICRCLELRSPRRVSAGFDRRNLRLSSRAVPAAGRDRALLDEVAATEGQGIVYCSTRRAVDRASGLLRAQGVSAAAYHAGMAAGARAEAQRLFTEGSAPWIVATCAFGMGVDKPDVRKVVHYNMPGSIEAYYQEAGRAGRDGLPADCVLLWNQGDIATQMRLITAPPAKKMPAAEARRLHAAKVAQLDAMAALAASGECLRAQILAYFGEEPPEDPCGNCSSCSRAEPGGEDGGLYGRLKRLRDSVARERGVEPRELASDGALGATASLRPVTLSSLRRVPGMGRASGDEWGKRVLALVRRETHPREGRSD